MLETVIPWRMAAHGTNHDSPFTIPDLFKPPC